MMNARLDVKFHLSSVAAAALLLCAALRVAAAEPAIADNSASNVAPTMVPGDAGTPTAAANDIEDARVTAQIRSALSNDKSLSVLARNVTIATNQQAVVLRGSVKADEKDRIESLAALYAGTRQVVDQLLIKDL